MTGEARQILYSGTISQTHEKGVSSASPLLVKAKRRGEFYVDKKKPPLKAAFKICKRLILLRLNGAGTRSRTRDLLITSQLLYQLSYTG